MTQPPVAQIRRARPSEARLLSDLALEAKQSWGYSSDQVEDWRETSRLSEEEIGTTNPIFVGDIGEEVAGFYSLVPAKGAWELDHLWVRPRFMRAGIGRALFEHALPTAYAGGASHEASRNRLPGSRVELTSLADGALVPSAVAQTVTASSPHS